MIEIQKTIRIDLSELLPREDWDFDRVLDTVAIEAAGTPLLQEIGIIPVGVEEDGTLRLRITGYLDEEDVPDTP